MHLGRLLSTISVGLALAHAAPTPDSTSEEDRSRPTKYFHEASFSVNYDERFASKALNETAQRDAAKVLVQTYLSTLRDLGVQTWLAGGSLLGWWWNKQVLPWDLDADVQVSENGIRFLAAYYNMTTWYYKYPRVPDGRFFQLEVNPNYADGSRDDDNAADARWIDMDSGLYIDVKAVRYIEDRPDSGSVLATKDGQEVRDTDLYPLLDTSFEGVKAKIPHKYNEMLAAEFGEKALTDKEYMDHKFIDSKMQWVPSDEL